MLMLALIGIPLLGGTLLLALRSSGIADRARESLALAIVAVSLGLGILCTYQVAQATAEGQASIAPRLEYSPAWLHLNLPAALATNSDGWQLSLGLDGIGAAMVLLTLIVAAAVMVIARNTVEKNHGDYASWILVATGGLLLVFSAMDLLLFYIGFEITLIPLFAMIAGWGNTSGFVAAKRFVLYTLVGSIPMVLGLFGISELYSGESGWTVHMPTLAAQAASMTLTTQQANLQVWVFLLLILGLGIKTAIIPLHTWLPTTYAASHPTTTAFLAAVVLKMGLFGFVRLVLPFTAQACAELGPGMFGWLGAIAIVAGALIALAQKDLSLMFAYSSLSHVGFITIGLFSLSHEGIGGATLQMFNHGITTVAMFLLVACMLIRRPNLRIDEHAGGLSAQFPRLGFFTVFFITAAAGMPGLNNFVGELLTLSGMMTQRPVVTGVAVLGVVLGAWYSFRMLQFVLFGTAEKTSGVRRSQSSTSVAIVTTDLPFEHKAVFGSLALICLFIGVMPNTAIGLFKSDVDGIARIYESSAATASASRLNRDTPPLSIAAHQLPASAEQATLNRLKVEE
jgi:NADH-quinone oxidoreductase subunit M